MNFMTLTVELDDVVSTVCNIFVDCNFTYDLSPHNLSCRGGKFHFSSSMYVGY